MNILRMLRDKSWLHPTDAAIVAQYDGPDTQAAMRIMLRFLLAVVSVIFFLFIITFLSRSQYPDFQALAGPPWQPFTDPSRLWFNTALLACASLGMHMGLRSARSGRGE